MVVFLPLQYVEHTPPKEMDTMDKTNGGVVLLTGKDVPPIPGQHPNTKYGFGRMKPGDFLFIPETPSRVQNAVRAHARRNPGFEFVTKKYTYNGVEGTGVWRVKGSKA